MNKKEADEKLEDFSEELTELAHKYDVALAYAISHDIEDGMVMPGFANLSEENPEEDMSFAISALCKAYYTYLTEKGMSYEKASEKVYVASLCGITINNENFIQRLERLQDKFEFFEMKKESETCKDAVKTFRDIQERS